MEIKQDAKMEGGRVVVGGELPLVDELEISGVILGHWRRRGEAAEEGKRSGDGEGEETMATA